jgi:hypothetical protein
VGEDMLAPKVIAWGVLLQWCSTQLVATVTAHSIVPVTGRLIGRNQEYEVFRLGSSGRIVWRLSFPCSPI